MAAKKNTDTPKQIRNQKTQIFSQIIDQWQQQQKSGTSLDELLRVVRPTLLKGHHHSHIIAASFPLDQCGTRISAGLWSLPGRRNLPSLVGPRPAATAVSKRASRRALWQLILSPPEQSLNSTLCRTIFKLNFMQSV